MLFQLPLQYIRLEISLGYQFQNKVTVNIKVGGMGLLKMQYYFFFCLSFIALLVFLHIAVGVVLLPDNYSS